MEEKQSLVSDYATLSAELEPISQELKQCRLKAGGLEEEVSGAKTAIELAVSELRLSEIQKNRGKLAPSELARLQSQLVDKEEQLAMLLQPLVEIKEHIGFLQGSVNLLNRRITNIKQAVAKDLVEQHAAEVATVASQPLQGLLVALVVSLAKESGYTVEEQRLYRQKLFTEMGEAIFNQSVKNLDAHQFGIPSITQARQQIAPLIEQMG